jgi:hypothetical protein
MDSNTLAVILAGLSVVGTLGGVLLGSTLETSAEERRRRRGAYEDSVVNAAEVATQLELIEAELRGGPPAPPLRPELARDVFRPMTRFALGAHAPIPQVDALREAVIAAVNPSTFGVTADDRATQRRALLAAMSALQEAARRDLHDHWWNRTLRRIDRPRT